MTKMFSQTDYEQIARAQVFTSDRQGLGRVDQLYVSDDTNTPTWVTINTGLFGMRTHFVPLTDAQIDGDRLYLPYTKDQITGAPSIDENGQLTPEEEAELFRHYGHDVGEPRTDPRMRSYSDEGGFRDGRWDAAGSAGVAGAAGAASAVDDKGPLRDERYGYADPRGVDMHDDPLDRDHDGRGPVGEVLDGPDDAHGRGAFEGDRRGEWPDDRRVGDTNPEAFGVSRDGGVIDPDRVDEYNERNVPRIGDDRAFDMDRDGDGRGPVREVLDGPDDASGRDAFERDDRR